MREMVMTMFVHHHHASTFTHSEAAGTVQPASRTLLKSGNGRLAHQLSLLGRQRPSHARNANRHLRHRCFPAAPKQAMFSDGPGTS